SFDGAVIARHIAGASALSSVDQFCAADVSGNGAISSVDIAKIAQFVVSATPLPAPNGAGTTASVPCHAHYQTTIPALKGDVTGQDAAISLGHGSVDVALPTMTGPLGTAIVIPITVSDVTGLDIFSYDFQITFDPSVIQPAFWDPTHDNTLQTGTLSHYVYI